MGIHVIKMPDIGEGIAEVELVEWHVQPGDTVAEDQLLADVMTDKATVEVPSPVIGKVVSLGGQVGQVLAVGSELIRLEVDGVGNTVDKAGSPARAAAAPESGTAKKGAGEVDGVAQAQGTSDALSAAGLVKPAAAALAASADVATSTSATEAQSAPSFSPASQTASKSASSNSDHASRPVSTSASTAVPRKEGEKPLASPAVRRRAADMGIDLRYVSGTSEAGRISHEDLDAYVARGTNPASAPAAGTAAFAQRDGEAAIAVIGLRRKIAQKMQESKRRIPHFAYVEEMDVTELEALRIKLNTKWGGQRGRLTLLPFLMRAVVLAVREFPQINARFDDDAGVVTQYQAVHLGVAAQTESGLMVPVLRHAETHDLWSSAAEVARLAEAARTGKAAREELSGSTLTISSLGALGGIVSTPVINYPEVAIIGVNRIVERPVILGGAVVARKIMNLSSSFDHRVVDGMHAAQFIQVVRGYLECPASLFLE